MKKYMYVYVNQDGSARELSLREKIYLQTDYHFGDSARPYIKTTYEEKHGAGDLSGFCLLDKLPPHVIVEPDTNTFTDDVLVERLRIAKGMGYEVDFTGIEEIRHLWDKV